jgi:hypothetical protein
MTDQYMHKYWHLEFFYLEVVDAKSPGLKKKKIVSIPGNQSGFLHLYIAQRETV